MKEPVEKLPLLARKDVRDNWENKKADHEQKLSETLGVPWSFTFDPKLIYANCDAEDWANRIGTAVEEYFSDFNSNVKQWVEKYGDDSREELNNICSDHVVEFHPQETTKFTYGGVEVIDRRLRIVFAEGCFSVNVSAITSPDVITDALSIAGQKADSGGKKTVLGLRSRQSIRSSWDPHAESLREEFARIIGLSDIQLVPNFEANSEFISSRLKSNEDGSSGQQDYLERIGEVTKWYFDGLKDYLISSKFDKDDMLQEALQEAISSRVIGLRIVEKLEQKTYNETVFSDGGMWMQAAGRDWPCNVSDVGSTIMDLL